MPTPLPRFISSTLRFMTAAICFAAIAGAAKADFVRLKISDDKHSIIKQDGSPFFYLGDTAWELFHRLNREEADRYLQNRADKGFTVIQAVAIAELDGHTDPNAYGHLPLTDLDPARPTIVDGPANDYWDHVDYIVDKANQLGLQIGFLPTWGRYWHDKVKDGKPLFDRKNAEIYGRWLGERYKDKSVIWILGGDRPIENDEQKEVIRAMAAGLRKGDGGTHLITFHPPGGAGSSQWLHDEPWLDFNMRQNGHAIEYTNRYSKTEDDYRKEPSKPVIDGEPVYEDHPVSFNAKELGYTIAADVRRAMYWDLFGGACGHTYGNHAVWQMYKEGKQPINSPLMKWDKAIDQPGAGQMRHAKWLIESRPPLHPARVVLFSSVKTSVPGAGTRQFVSARTNGCTCAMIYAPVGRPFTASMAASGQKIRAWWFNPRDGSGTVIGEFPIGENREFTPPTPGESLDWVLVLDAVEKNYPLPPAK